MYLLTWKAVENTSTIFGLLGSIFALFAWIQAGIISRNIKKEKERLNQEIKIVLQGDDDDHVISLPLALRRRELTRSELLGLLGMLPMKNKGKRYEIRFLNTADFREAMSRVQDATEETVMTIPCTNKEIDQFNGGVK